MTRGTQRILCSFTAAAALLVAVLWLQGAWSSTARASTTATEYFASSSGSGSACVIGSPCLITTALATAANGDTIYVKEGTYTGNGPSVITISASITLYGGWKGTTDYPPVRDPQGYPTTLDGEYERRVIFTYSPFTPTIDGFIITRGNASHAPYDAGQGGGIYSRWASPIISNNTISGNIACTDTSTYAYGGGAAIYAPGTRSVITGNLFYSNTASTSFYAQGGGLVVSGRGSEPSLIVNNTLLGNTASVTNGVGYGGAIRVVLADDTVLRGNTVEHNVAMGGVTGFASSGGGISCNASDDVSIENNVLQYNVASIRFDGSGGAIAAADCDRMTVISNTIRYNRARPDGTSGVGGGLSFFQSLDLSIDRNVIISNTGRNGGGLIVNSGSSSVSFTMTNNIIAENESGYQGGGLAFRATAIHTIKGTLVHNTFAANNLGALAGRNAIHVYDPGVALVLTNNIICSHTYGVAVGDSGSSATLDNNLFFSNTSGDTSGAGTIVNNNAITGQNPLLDATYHLMDGSPAILAGLTLGWPALDIDREARRLAVPDIGADDHQYAFPCEIYLPLLLRSY